MHVFVSRWFASAAVCVALLAGPVSACDLKSATAYDQKIRAAIAARDNAALETYAIQQAAVYHACAAQNSGHTKTRYLLGEAASWDQAAQALNTESTANVQKKRGYARKAINIVTPIASSTQSSDNEKKAANAILWTLGWARSGP